MNGTDIVVRGLLSLEQTGQMIAGSRLDFLTRQKSIADPGRDLHGRDL
jgi:hypothetical protein